MMNTRVLELLKNPKNIQSEDLHLLKEEINSFPYIQNIRALHLYGVHLFDKENYQKELSVTAAYTTDKKILYQLINGKIQQRKTETLEKEPQVTADKPQNTKEPFWWVKEKKTFPKHDYKTASENLATPKAEIKHVVVNGERNRILFEGEENYLEEKNADTIDLESTLESGVIVTQKSSFPIKRTVEAEKTTEDNPPVEVSNENIHENVINSENNSETEVNIIEAEFAKPETETSKEESVENENSTENIDTENVLEAAKSEVVISEDAIDSEKIVEKVNDESEVSFLEVESFEPEAEVQAEESIDSGNVEGSIDTENVLEAAKSEVIISEDSIDSEKVAEKINDESEVSFLEVESFEPEAEVQTEESIDSENLEKHNENEEVVEALNPKVIINEDEIDSKDVSEKINDESELSFHGTDAFLPEVKIEAPISEQINPAETPKSTINKHEDEMRRLIEEVEKKMKAAQKKESEAKANEPEEESGREISFAETQDFVVSNEIEAEEKTEAAHEEVSEEKNETPVLEEVKEENSGWKPMSIESHTPDSFSKKIEIETVQEEKPEEVKEVLEEIILEEEKLETVAENISEEVVNEVENPEPEIADSAEKEEVRVMNVSFFGADISSLAIKKEEEKQQDFPQEKVEELPLQEEKQTLLDSNVPGFINTWQSWLKIDRTEEIEKVKTEIKNKAIESFIENNPKISQLKDEVNFVVKEKTDDISHLMTETLANLYIEQKLYTKAINAFHTLANKHPERKEYFENRIQEVKDNRGKN
ncbi:hypothetical protein [Chryseobacterium sp. YIM B08800]|uniref:hypothetical protein n=1 Tax=Chryseobacterium sp. YIM B08800 TaxID=2984136 RepID=UPI002240A35E|nr:hypothetical protein [Chryseobacterium sp. YIM B08800]